MQSKHPEHEKAQTRTPIALTIAGSDSGGGAGIQADLKAFSALGAYGASVITALTAQNTQSVCAIHEVPAAFVAEQLLAVLTDLDVCAIKIGMLANAPIIETVATVLKQYPDIPVVLDPVMIAKSGDALLKPEAVSALLDHLCPLATVITPNIPEAACLIDGTEATSLTQMQEQAQQLSESAQCAVLIKGGHLETSDSTDLLYIDKEIHSFAFARINTRNTHGTGCTLSSAIAAGLANALSVPVSVKSATQYVHNAIAAADDLNIGAGHGPVHHFHALWDR